MEIKNAIIKSVQLTKGDHGVLSAWLHLDFGGSGQGFGGRVLYTPSHPDHKTFCGLFIWRVLEIAGVEDWEKLVGRPIRVKADHSQVYAIGHILNDEWFDPAQELNKLGDF